MKFKCKISGCIVEFLAQVDIDTTLANSAYEVVPEEVQTPIVKQETFPLAKKLYTVAKKLYTVKG